MIPMSIFIYMYMIITSFYGNDFYFLELAIVVTVAQLALIYRVEFQWRIEIYDDRLIFPKHWISPSIAPNNLLFSEIIKIDSNNDGITLFSSAGYKYKIVRFFIGELTPLLREKRYDIWPK